METLYVSALPFQANEKTIRQLFSEIGQIGTVQVFADWENPTHEPYALVEVDDALKTIREMDGKKIGYTHLRVHEWRGK